jgi:hypothetical protein
MPVGFQSKGKGFIARFGILPTLLLITPWTGYGQFLFTTNADDTITIWYYIGPDSDLTIPDTINGLPVTTLGMESFFNRPNLTRVTIPDGVTSIGLNAFRDCDNLTNVTIPNSVTNIGFGAFAYSPLMSATIPGGVSSLDDETFAGCYLLTNLTLGNGLISIWDRAFADCGLTDVTIPDSVTSIGISTFVNCINLTNVTLGNSVASIGSYAFSGCTNLTSAFFQGNAPAVDDTMTGDDTIFDGGSGTVYYVPGTTGWTDTFGGWTTAPWHRPNPQILANRDGLGVRSNGFTFTVSWATNSSVVAEACTNLANLGWRPLATNALSNGICTFTDPQWTNYPSRFYRVHSR